ncbi:phage baseplate assembly protein V [Pseudooceanicola sp. CBS1P-1]|uniref:Phage baseplate assembly protein V n=1 Tax=Pseudooceanicola albus TaxID=2692189 RepID=A0A6L7FYH5_9RHOB|nr:MULTISPECIES: phage baseplate assembly protein V [Pseudooceanicola]MBT9383327.1 phage baseplate assembly protein V [Pseudooceanicola endophyticus]MXN16350.1 phage baseplate assembly protein V [Pseudooceanicola albus]
MSRLVTIIDDLRRRVADLERRLRGQTRTGVIVAVDPANGLARVQLQDGDSPFLTGWIPWEEAAAGAMKTHTPPSVGQQVRLFSESGDLVDATIQGSLNSDANGRPSGAGDAFILASVGGASITITGGGSQAVVTVGAATLTLDPDAITLDAATITLRGNVAAEGGSLTHNGTNVGDTHTHGGITAGPSSTGTPE